MGSKTQVVKFEAYQAYTVEDGKRKLANITPLINRINKLGTSDRSVIQYGVKIRMDHIHKIRLSEKMNEGLKKTDLTYFHLTKLRDEGIAITTADTEALKDLNLTIDEYVAEDISCIFDSELHTLFIQRNYYASSITGITQYLKAMSDKIDDREHSVVLDFKPVKDSDILKKVSNVTNYRSLEIGFASSSQNALSKFFTNALGDLGNIFKDFDGKNLLLTITAGDRDQPSLNNESMQAFTKSLENGETPFSKTIIKGKEGDMPVEKYDLINGKLSVSHRFSSVKNSDDNVTRKMHLDPKSVEEVMVNLYLGENGLSKQAFRNKIIKQLKLKKDKK